MMTFDAFRLGLAAAFTAALNFVIHHVFMCCMQIHSGEGMRVADMVSSLVSAEVLKVVIVSSVEGFVLGYLFAIVYNSLSKK
jgi:hypothetical protein